MENDLQKRIEETLDSANHVKPVSPKPFFYTRLKAKMEIESSPSVIQLIPTSLRATCALILIMNAAFFFSTFFQSKTENTSQQLASFYEFNSTSVYSNQ
jgi:type VI protein secretion system component VasF